MATATVPSTLMHRERAQHLPRTLLRQRCTAAAPACGAQHPLCRHQCPWGAQPSRPHSIQQTCLAQLTLYQRQPPPLSHPHLQPWYPPRHPPAPIPCHSFPHTLRLPLQVHPQPRGLLVTYMLLLLPWVNRRPPLVLPLDQPTARPLHQPRKRQQRLLLGCSLLLPHPRPWEESALLLLLPRPTLHVRQPRHQRLRPQGHSTRRATPWRSEVYQPLEAKQGPSLMISPMEAGAATSLTDGASSV
mmetsp:Transcript_3232/g.8598  ORF Transcript_3232/g.8598 Transcript_3232/m.8598 type:complete len:244 (+) Transcript_3232:700-1431(+)